MDYEKKYNNLKAKINNAYLYAQTDSTKAVLEKILPELKENKDERIRKNCIHFLELQKKHHAAPFEIEECIIWLEKQAEQKPADKTEPKFKVGDWIICMGFTAKILALQKHYYIGIDTNGNDFVVSYSNECEIKKWSIEDASDGDVLVCENGWTCIFKTLVNDETFSSYCFMDATTWFCETGSDGHTLQEEFVKAYGGKLYPATKEQRKLFFQKMKEAGYTWNAKKKELKYVKKN